MFLTGAAQIQILEEKLVFAKCTVESLQASTGREVYVACNGDRGLASFVRYSEIQGLHSIGR